MANIILQFKIKDTSAHEGAVTRCSLAAIEASSQTTFRVTECPPLCGQTETKLVLRLCLRFPSSFSSLLVLVLGIRNGKFRLASLFDEGEISNNEPSGMSNNQQGGMSNNELGGMSNNQPHLKMYLRVGLRRHYKSQTLRIPYTGNLGTTFDGKRHIGQVL
ncbi:hypothetical protein V8G54_026731 [Vigna mungo]|uniref:Uncharacterized protein n=1 Tax=Vigna mungo TaxID=3915 RepID=A0AAQ3RNG0_VIGMU